MSIKQSSTPNLLIRAMSAADYGLIQAYLVRVQLAIRSSMFEPNKPIEQIYFPDDVIGSIVAEQEDGDQVEVGLYG